MKWFPDGLNDTFYAFVPPRSTELTQHGIAKTENAVMRVQDLVRFYEGQWSLGDREAFARRLRLIAEELLPNA